MGDERAEVRRNRRRLSALEQLRREQPELLANQRVLINQQIRHLLENCANVHREQRGVQLKEVADACQAVLPHVRVVVRRVREDLDQRQPAAVDLGASAINWSATALVLSPMASPATPGTTHQRRTASAG